MFESPMSPATSKSAEGLSTISLTSENGIAIIVEEWLPILIELWDSSFAKVLLCQNIGGDLTPVVWNRDVVLMENNGAIRIPDFRLALSHLETGIWALSFCCETAFDLQLVSSLNLPSCKCVILSMESPPVCRVFYTFPLLFFSAKSSHHVTVAASRQRFDFAKAVFEQCLLTQSWDDDFRVAFPVKKQGGVSSGGESPLPTMQRQSDPFSFITFSCWSKKTDERKAPDSFCSEPGLFATSFPTDRAVRRDFTFTLAVTVLIHDRKFRSQVSLTKEFLSEVRSCQKFHPARGSSNPLSSAWFVQTEVLSTWTNKALTLKPCLTKNVGRLGVGRSHMLQHATLTVRFPSLQLVKRIFSP